MPLIRKPPGFAPPAGEPPQGDLESPSPDLRWAAARAAVARPGSVGDLAKALGRETDARVREAICTALVRIGSPESVEAVLPLLRSDDASIRTAAMDVLRAMPGPLRPRIAALLADPDADVRLLACELARELTAPEAEKLLLSVIEADSDPNVCAGAIDALSEVGGAGALPALARCAARFFDNPFLVFAARAASERLGAAPGRD
jgi:HEAT repeat protein